MTPRQFATAALSLPDVVEAEHMGHPDFRVNGKIFASLGAPSDEWGMVKLSPDQQQSFIAAAPETFQPCTGAWGRQGYTNVRLKDADTDLVKESQRLAHESIATAQPRKRSRSSSRRKK